MPRKLSPIRRSLVIKLALAFWVVALIGTLLTSSIVGVRTAREFSQYIDLDNRRRGERDGFRPPPRPGFPSTRFEPGSPEDIFEEGVGRALFLGICGSTLVALLLGLFLARYISRPLRELTAATEAVAQGELGRQVSVPSQDEIGQLSASFNKMSRDLEQANQLRRQMTADIAHDLRTPLSVIAGYTEALEDGKLEGNPQMYQVMHTQVQHLQYLIDDLRTLSLADAGELPLNSRPVDPAALLEKTVLTHMAQAEEKGVEIHVQASDDLPAIKVDLERMVQVLSNLVGNALRYTAAGQRITLSAEQAESRVLLRVADEGEGIAAEELPHIFERFYRSDKARQRSKGESGLGLAIAKSIVESHGGEISAKSTLGKGTIMTVSLPIK